MAKKSKTHEAQPHPATASKRDQQRTTLVMDSLIALSLWLGAFAFTLWTAEDIGVGYDEPIYSSYALRYQQWLQLLVNCWASGEFLLPFQPQVIDAYWHAKDMHPPIPKLISALGYWFLTPLLGSDFAGMRSGTALLYGLMLAGIYWFGRQELSRMGALFAALAVAFMPRLFADAHFLTMDMPVTATTTLGTLLLLRFLQSPNLWRGLAATLGVGMAFASKANGFLIVPAALLFLLIRDWVRSGAAKQGEGMNRAERWKRFGRTALLSSALLALVTVGAFAFLFATWLWLWVDPLPRFLQYFGFHAKHFLVHTFYLGRLWEMAAWHYPLVMTAVTVPTITLLLALIGMGVTVAQWRTAPAIAQMALISYFVHIAPFMLPTTPKYNGIRLFEPAFPFLGLLAGYAFGRLAHRLQQWLEERGKPWVSNPKLVLAGVMVGLSAPAAFGTIHSHPFGLSYYNALVGGVRKAKEWFEVTYWGVNLLNVVPFLNRQPDGTAVLFLPGWALYPTVDFYRNARVIREGIVTMGNPKDLPKADFVVFQASQTEMELMRREDPVIGELLFRLWREAKPAYAAAYDGVVIVGVYDRETVAQFLPPQRGKASDRSNSPFGLTKAK